MDDVAFLITNQYQIHHFAPIARLLDDVTFVIEHRDHDFGVSAAFIHEHLPGVPVEDIEHKYLHLLDGRFRVIVCHTPVLPHRLLKKSMVVAQQYSLAKETYQYGAWRSLATLNLMYGPYSLDRVQGFSDAVMVGNPSMDRFFQHRDPPLGGSPPDAQYPLRVLYLPTYGPQSSVDATLPRFAGSNANVTVKLHHAHLDDVVDLPDNCTLVGAGVSPADLLLDHDCVISDVSGAAYDALYARRPLVRVGDGREPAWAGNPLSDDDSDRNVLAPLSAKWSDGPLDEAYRRAATLVGDDQLHATFVAERYVHHGEAAQVAAAAIVNLLDDGPPRSFSVHQVRTRLTDLISEKNRLAEQTRVLRKQNDRLRSPSQTLVHRVAEPARKRTISTLHRLPRLQRSLVKFKQALAGRLGTSDSRGDDV